MKKYIYTVIAASCAMFASCSQESEFASQSTDIQGKAITEISASSGVESRAGISSTDNTKINWQSGDVIRVFGADGSSAATSSDYTLLSGEGTVNGAFTNASSTVSSIQAVIYPAQLTAKWDNTNSKLKCKVPSVQTAVKGSFDQSAAVMYYIGDKTNVILNSAVAFLKVTVTSSEKAVHAITISSSTPLSGDISITSDGVASVYTAEGDGTSDYKGSEIYVTLQASTNDEEALAAGDYYIAVVPGTYKDLAIAYKYTDHTAKAKSEKPNSGQTELALTAGHVKAISVDLSSAEVCAYQLWAGGPFFALKNLGASKSTEAGLFYSWGSLEGNSGALNSDNLTCSDGKIYNFSTMPFNNNSSSYNGDYFTSTGWKEATGNKYESGPKDGQVLCPKYDAATQTLGYAWKIPTKDEWLPFRTSESYTKVSYTANQLDGNLHYNVAKGTTGKSINLPIAGSRGASRYYENGKCLVDNPYYGSFQDNIVGRYQVSTLIWQYADDYTTNKYWRWDANRMEISHTGWSNGGLGAWCRYMGEYIRAVLR